MDKNTTLTINKRYFEFEEISKNKTLVKEIEESRDKLSRIIEQFVVDYSKFRDRKILSRMSERQLKNLIKRCEEVLAEKREEQCRRLNEEFNRTNT